MNALRLSPVITELSLHILIKPRRSIKSNIAYQRDLTKSGCHLLPSVMVSYKQVSNICNYFSLTHILLWSPKDITNSNSLHFFKWFSFLFFIYSCHKRLWSAYKRIGFPLILREVLIYFHNSHSLRWNDPSKGALDNQKLTLPSLPLKKFRVNSLLI